MFPTAPNTEINERDMSLRRRSSAKASRSLRRTSERCLAATRLTLRSMSIKSMPAFSSSGMFPSPDQGTSKEQVSRTKGFYDSATNSLNAKGPKTKLRAAPRPYAHRASSQSLAQVPSGPSYLRVRFPLSILRARSERTGSVAATLQESTLASPTRSQLSVCSRTRRPTVTSSLTPLPVNRFPHHHACKDDSRTWRSHPRYRYVNAYLV